MAVAFGAGRSPDLPTCGDRYRTLGDGDEIRDIQTVRSRYRRGDFTFDAAESFHDVTRVAERFEFNDDDQSLGFAVRD